MARRRHVGAVSKGDNCQSRSAGLLPRLDPIIKLLMVTGDAVRAILLYKGSGRRVLPVLFVLRSCDLGND
jgi:hypothetical protein